MTDVYENCPVFENDSYILRMTSQEDKSDLLKVYSDKAAVSFFNSDNCGGDDFYYTTESRMEQAIAYWLFEYNRAGFVRWTIVSKETNEAIGTIDIRSDYERAGEITKILKMIIEPAYTLFHCDKIAAKAIAAAAERIRALEQLGFKYTDEKLIGHDGTKYDSYFVLNRNE